MADKIDETKSFIFFDAHNHLFNLSHPGFIALIKRYLMNNNLDIDDLIRGKFLKIFISIISSQIPLFYINKRETNEDEDKKKNNEIKGKNDPKNNKVKKEKKMKLNIPIFIFFIFSILFYIGVFFTFLFFLINIINDKNHSNSFIFCVITTLYVFLTLSLIFFVMKIVNKIVNHKFSSMAKKPVNLLYFMEMDVTNQLLLLENDVVSMDDDLKELDYLKLSDMYLNIDKDQIKNKDRNINESQPDINKQFFLEAEKKFKGTINLNNLNISKFVLTPLIMDFGKKFKASPDIYYSYLYIKPIFNQVTDLLLGIKRYFAKSPFKIFEIFPFLGINVKNYTSKELEIILETYFKNYQPDYNAFSKHYQKTFNNNDTFDLKINKDGSIIINSEDKENDIDNSMFFAGIKVYPPLGFDFWPEDQDELDKVIILYEYCNKKGIPITVHYGTGGFETYSEEEISEFICKWKVEKVFEHLEKKKPVKIKFDLAHMGLKFEKVNGQYEYKKTKVTENIFSLIRKYPKNIFTDVSDRPMSESLKKILGEYKDYNDNILFGSDIPVVLFLEESYKDYLEKYIMEAVKNEDYKKFFSENPMKYLF